MSESDFENIYDKYCSMLYSISLQICYENKKEAEELLTCTFKKIHKQDITPEKFPSYCITLIRLVIKTAGELYPLNFERGFRLKQFKNTPLINEILCNQITLPDFCKEKALSLQEAMQIIRIESGIIRSFPKENAFGSDKIFSAETVLA